MNVGTQEFQVLEGVRSTGYRPFCCCPVPQHALFWGCPLACPQSPSPSLLINLTTLPCPPSESDYFLFLLRHQQEEQRACESLLALNSVPRITAALWHVEGATAGKDLLSFNSPGREHA